MHVWLLLFKSINKLLGRWGTDLVVVAGFLGLLGAESTRLRGNSFSFLTGLVFFFQTPSSFHLMSSKSLWLCNRWMQKLEIQDLDRFLPILNSFATLMGREQFKSVAKRSYYHSVMIDSGNLQLTIKMVVISFVI